MPHVRKESPPPYSPPVLASHNGSLLSEAKWHTRFRV